VVSEPSWRVVVDLSRCVGSGMCLFAEPAVFDQDDVNGLVVVVNDHPSSDVLDNVRRAVETCPGQAIRLEVEDVGVD
jgi:ferredoxin